MIIPRFGFSYTVGRSNHMSTHLDLPSEVEVSIDGRAFRIVVEDKRIFIETFDRRTAIIPERELLAEYER
jgi:hypothetical protein